MVEIFNQIRHLRQVLNPLEKLFVFAILVISIDGFPLLPLNNENRPLATFVLLVYWLWYKLLNFKIEHFEKKMLFIFAILLAFTFYRGWHDYHSFKGFIKFFMTGTLSIITISSCMIFMRGLLERFSVQQSLNIITYAFILSTLLPLLVGVIQFFALSGIIPRGVGDAVTLLFSYRPILNRVQMLNTEPAHASAYISFVIFWVYSFYKDSVSFRNIYLLVLFAAFLFINSSVGYISFVLTLFFYWLLCLKKNLQKTALYVVYTLVAGVTIYYLSSFFLVGYTANKLGMISSLLIDLNPAALLLNFQSDYSLLDRFGTPVLGLVSLADTSYLGTGGESFYYLYLDLIRTYFPEMLYNKQLTYLMSKDAHFTVKFLPAKIATEFGLIGLFAFLYYVRWMFSRINFIHKTQADSIFTGLCLCFIYTFISTYMCSYFHFIVILGFVITFAVYEYSKDQFATA